MSQHCTGPLLFKLLTVCDRPPTTNNQHYPAPYPQDDNERRITDWQEYYRNSALKSSTQSLIASRPKPSDKTRELPPSLSAMASSYTPHALALPQHFSPDTLDVLTELADVLQKVHESARESLQRDNTAQQTPSQKQQPSQTGQTPSQSTTAAQSQPKPAVGGPASAAAGSASGTEAAGGKRLTFKDVPGATDGIKHKLQKAREQVRALPDMGRTVGDQRAEIEELEARIEKQRALLGRLREGGLAFGKEVADRMET